MKLRIADLPPALTGDPAAALDRKLDAARTAIRQTLIDAMAAYDPADAALFAKLLRRSMDVIADHRTLARLIGASVPTLHRWSKQQTEPTPLERAGIIALLRTVVIHGLPAVEARFPRMLKAVSAQLALQMPEIVAAQAGAAKPRTKRTTKPRPSTPVEHVRSRRREP